MNSHTNLHIRLRETNAIIGEYDYQSRCAKEIEPFIREYFDNIRQFNFKIDDITDNKVDDQLWRITDMVYYLSRNAIEGVSIEEREIEYIKKIFDIFNDFVNKCVNENIFQDISKLASISYILEENSIREDRKVHEEKRNKVFFDDFEYLYNIIYRINTQWEDLVSRGFSRGVIKDFFDVMRREKFSKEIVRTEKEKYDIFMQILDGKMKFKPVYEPIAYTIVPLKHKEKIIESNNNFYGYSLKESE